MYNGKTVVLGVTGSIAAYKAADLASKLTQAGVNVDVVMTESASKFVTPLTFRSLTHRPVFTDLFKESSDWNIEHVALAERADVVVIAPATANTIAKTAHGFADDLLSCIVLATVVPTLVAPAMNARMYENPITQDNLAKLRERGFSIIEPAQGYLACGESGSGRLADIEDIMGALFEVLGRNDDLSGKRIVVTAGGTQEPIDPVRCITNHSSGKMGYALAQAARDRGSKVTLVTAPTALSIPAAIEVIKVQTAIQMQEAVLQATDTADALIMAAAVADYRPSFSADRKIKKGSTSLSLELSKNPDILSGVRGNLIKVGFAAESDDLKKNALSKLRAKNLDIIVANDITIPESTFGADTNKVVIIEREGQVEELPLMPKSQVAHKILDKVRDRLGT